MAQFTLNWLNASLLANPNSEDQTAYYRQKSVGGVWVSAGFTPANPLATSANSTLSPVLLSNVVYQFKVDCNCTDGGPSENDNGIQEAIKFFCIVPDTATKTETTATATIDVTGLDITKAKFTLRLASNNSVVTTATVNRIGNSISHTATGLTAGTNYYWQVELYATVNAIEVISSSPQYLGQACSPYPVTTDVIVVCDPVTAADINSIEIP